MTRSGVIKTYLANLNLYKHLLSLEEQEDNHKNFKAYLRKEYPVNTKKIRYNQNNQLCPTKKYLHKYRQQI